MDPREIVQIILDALRRCGYDADVRNLSMAVADDDFHSLGDRNGLRLRVPSAVYELDINLVIDRRSVEEKRRREEREQRERQQYLIGQLDSVPMVGVDAAFPNPLTNRQIGDYFRDGIIPADIETVRELGRDVLRVVKERAPVAAWALVRSLRMPVAFIDIWALVRMFVDIVDYCGDALVRWSLLEYR